MDPDNRLRRFFSPVVRNRREYRAFVTKVTVGAVIVALATDVVNQLLFAETWEQAIKSWVVTVVMATAISLVASIITGRAYLDLFDAKTAVDILSRTDPLTGLPNRRAFFETAEASTSETMVLAIADIDRFKRVNDTHGHLVGDEVLRTVGGLMATELGSVAYVGRVGGEEFALVASAAAVDEVLAVLDAFRIRIAATPIMAAGAAVGITVSAGVAIRRPGVAIDEVYAEADRALYQAKAAGRNRICLALSAQRALAVLPDRERKRWQRYEIGDGPAGDAQERALSA